jgi:hypothetical protein
MERHRTPALTRSVQLQIAYLVSPSARKNTHAVHNDKKEYPGLKKKSETAGSGEQHLKPVMMTDDEGKEENVAGSLALAEVSIAALPIHVG